MSRLKFRDEGESHNFWQNYTDLMSGFLIVFIIASLAAYSEYKGRVDMFTEAGAEKSNIKDVVVTAEIYKKIKSFEVAKNNLNKRFIKYNSTFKRFECSVPVQFDPNSDVIPEKYKKDLVSAGEELIQTLQVSSEDMKNQIGFTIVIEGRAAKPWNMQSPNVEQQKYAEELSYRRSRNLFHLWQGNGVIAKMEAENCNIFITGSGYGGRFRYTGKDEDKNKTFIIQVTPYIKN